MNVTLLPTALTAEAASEPSVPEPPSSVPPELVPPEHLSSKGCRKCRVLGELCPRHEGVQDALDWVVSALVALREGDVR